MNYRKDHKTSWVAPEKSSGDYMLIAYLSRRISGVAFLHLIKIKPVLVAAGMSETQTTYGLACPELDEGLSNEGNRYRGLLQLLTNVQTLRNTRGW